jgi:hypothetical protein
MNADIREAFETRILAFASGQEAPLPIAWENVTYTPSPGTMYIECFMAPAPSQNPWMGAIGERLVGFYQINVYGVQDAGPALAEAIADGLIALFPRGGMTQNGTIINIDQTGSRAKGINTQNGFFFIPVRIRYRQDVFG